MQEKIIFTAHNFTVFKLESMGAALGPPHRHRTRSDAPPTRRFGLFFFYSRQFQLIRAESSRNWPKLAEIMAEIRVKKIIKINLWVVF